MMASLFLIQPLHGWLLGGAIQGSRCCANPSLYNHNPVGVEEREKPEGRQLFSPDGRRRGYEINR